MEKNTGLVKKNKIDKEDKRRADVQSGVGEDSISSSEDEETPKDQSTPMLHVTAESIEEERGSLKLDIMTLAKIWIRCWIPPPPDNKENIPRMLLNLLEMKQTQLSGLHLSRDTAPAENQCYISNQTQSPKTSEKKKFSTPLNKIPKYNLMNINESNKFFKATLSSINTTTVVAYKTEQDYITAWEKTLASYNTDIELYTGVKY